MMVQYPGKNALVIQSTSLAITENTNWAKECINMLQFYKNAKTNRKNNLTSSDKTKKWKVYLSNHKYLQIQENNRKEIQMRGLKIICSIRVCRKISILKD